MVYRKDEKEKMALLLKIFQCFIREQWYFDIVYSEKLGYLRIVPGGETADDQVFRIPDFDTLLKTLADDMIFERMRASQRFAPSLQDLEAVRCLWERKLCFTQEENRRCLEMIDGCIASWKQDPPFIR